MITILISTKMEHSGYMKENAVLMFLTQQKPFQVNKISQYPHQRSKQLALALAILKSVKIISGLLWITSLLLSLVKDFGISAFLLTLLPTTHVGMKVTNPVSMTDSLFCS